MVTSIEGFANGASRHDLEFTHQDTKKLPDAKGRAVSVFSRVLRSLSLRNENRVDDVGFNFTGTL